jgi:hypothetical protein
LFLLYINDIPKATEHNAIPILFADDTSILITSPNNIQFHNNLNIVSGQLNKWFEAKLLSLNFDKTHFIQFTNKSTCTPDFQIMLKDKQTPTATEMKFLRLFINNTLSWKTHIEYIKHKLSSVCYAMQSVKPYVSLNIFNINNVR